MIDTIVVRIHKINCENEYIQKVLREYRNDDTQIRLKGSVHQQDDFKDFIYYSDTDKIQHLFFRSSLYNFSSHYTIAYSINTSRDFAEINFSIPKYIFGTNVLQFTDTIAFECERWRFSAGKPLLLNRRKRESALYFSNDLSKKKKLQL